MMAKQHFFVLDKGLKCESEIEHVPDNVNVKQLGCIIKNISSINNNLISSLLRQKNRTAPNQFIGDVPKWRHTHMGKRVLKKM